MNTDLQNRLTLKLFLGVSLTSELKLLLSQSSSWKQSQIGPKSECYVFEEIHYHEKDYLGFYLPQEQVTLQELRELKGELKNRLQGYVPKYELDSLKVYVFSQIFVA